MAVLSWIRIVGDVWLVGTHPQWPESADANPLVIEIEGSLSGPSIRGQAFRRGGFPWLTGKGQWKVTWPIAKDILLL
jgi:hypothetical protein